MKSTSLGGKEPDVIEENLSEAADIYQPQRTGPEVKVNGCINAWANMPARMK